MDRQIVRQAAWCAVDSRLLSKNSSCPYAEVGLAWHRPVQTCIPHGEDLIADNLASMSNHTGLLSVSLSAWPCLFFSPNCCLFPVFNLVLITFIPYLLLFYSYSIPPSLPPPVSLLLMPCDRELIPYMPSRLSRVSPLFCLPSPC